MWMASLPYEAALGFLLCAGCYAALLFGYRTHLAQYASLLCVLSLHGRVLLTQNGGDVVLSELCLWTTFLPTGRRYSIDSLRERARAGSGPSVENAPVCRLAVLALLLQLSFIYLLSAAQKTGPTWRQGTAVHFVLYQARIVTPVGLWAREHLSSGALRIASWAAVGIEWSLPVLLLSPVATRVTRLVALGLICALHIGFATFLNLGVFVPAMIAFAPNLLARADWEALSRCWRRHGAYQASLRRAAAPFLGVVIWLSRFDTVSASPRLLPMRWRGFFREVAVAALMLLAGSQLLLENQALRTLRPVNRPQAVLAAVNYLQLFQGWSLFAPDAPLTDMNVFVDAVTADGRHVDPFNERASPASPHPGASIPQRLGQSSAFCSYLTRIESYPEYFQAFTEWILRYPERTGRPQDRVVSFQAFVVEQDSPVPGAMDSHNVRVRTFLRFPN